MKTDAFKVVDEDGIIYGCFFDEKKATEFANNHSSYAAVKPLQIVGIQLYAYKCKIVGVYDADTVTAEIDVGFKIKFTEKIRLFGIDAPEIRGEERQQGLEARDALRGRVLGKEIYIQTIKDRKGKYGRYLGVLHDDNGNINEWLVLRNWAVKSEY